MLKLTSKDCDFLLFICLMTVFSSRLWLNTDSTKGKLWLSWHFIPEKPRRMSCCLLTQFCLLSQDYLLEGCILYNHRASTLFVMFFLFQGLWTDREAVDIIALVYCFLWCWLFFCVVSLSVIVRLFPLREPGVNYMASELTKKEIEVSETADL